MTQPKRKLLYFRLLDQVRPYWLYFGISLACMLVLAAIEPMLTLVMEQMLDGIFVNKDSSLVRLIPLALIIIFLIRGLANIAGTLAINAVSNRVVMNLRNAMFDTLLRLPASYYQNNTSGKLISRFTYDVNQITSAATDVFVILIKDSLTVICLIGVMIWYNWKLTLIALLVLPVIAIVVRIVSHRMRRLNTSLQTRMGDLTHVLDESIKGHKVVKIFGGQHYEANRFFEISNWVRRYGNKIVAASTSSVSFVQLMTASALALIVFIAAHQSIEQNNISAGQFTAFIGAMALLFSPIKRLTKVNENLQRGLAAATSIFALIDMPGEVQSGTHTLEQTHGHLRFEDIHFQYENANTPALKGVSFEVMPGQTVALVGHSGSGKTTLCNLVPRFYELEKGRILLDEVDIKSLPLDQLRAQMALVSQDVVLFNDNVCANIAYGPFLATQTLDQKQVIQAAETAGAKTFIEEMPDGFDTLIGENGTRLSGGQRQRLAIARALFKDAPILLLDEATSALDSQTEKLVQEALEELRKGRTTLVIAHRLSTIENADRIIVLDQGEIVEQGTHEELIRHKGRYFNLYNSQQKASNLSD